MHALGLAAYERRAGMIRKRPVSADRKQAFAVGLPQGLTLTIL